MTQAFGQDRSPRRRGVVLLSVLGGAVLGVLLATAGMASRDAHTELLRVDTAPTATHAAAQHAAAIDAGVDWSRVETSPADAGASVAAYER